VCDHLPSLSNLRAMSCELTIPSDTRAITSLHHSFHLTPSTKLVLFLLCLLLKIVAIARYLRFGALLYQLYLSTAIVLTKDFALISTNQKLTALVRALINGDLIFKQPVL
jgi:hypothetical protein